MSREMAYVVTVNRIDPIDGKDRIVYAHFEENGYGVICDKSFTVGEKVVYFEVDSILPVHPKFEFLRKRCFNARVNGFVIKNMKMSGLYSNGLILHFNEAGVKPCKAGTALTNCLKVGKLEDYEDASPVPMKKNPLRDFMMRHALTRKLAKLIWFRNKVSRSFPSQYIAKSDETNIQNEKNRFDDWKDTPCYITNKHEGQSMTLIMLPNKKSYDFKVFGRNTDGNDKQYAWAEKADIESKFKNVWKNTSHCYAVQGEFCGPNIQSNIYKFPQYRFFAYTVKDITDGKFLDYNDMVSFCNTYGFERVQCQRSDVKLSDLFGSLEELQEYTEHLWFNVEDVKGEDSQKWVVFNDTSKNFEKLAKPKYHRWEGVVIRGMKNEFSFKVKSNEYQIDGL